MRFDAINSGPPVTAEDVEAYGQANSLSLPAALKRQLVEQNGGAPKADAFIDIDGRAEELLSFFGIRMGEPSSELAWIEKSLGDRLPSGMLAFADDPAGNLFLVETGPTDRVWFWDHERGDDPPALSPVAASLDAFFTSLDIAIT
jgi:hypothetical protein